VKRRNLSKLCKVRSWKLLQIVRATSFNLVESAGAGSLYTRLVAEVFWRKKRIPRNDRYAMDRFQRGPEHSQLRNAVAVETSLDRRRILQQLLAAEVAKHSEAVQRAHAMAISAVT
jgi:hypothetical protein